MGDMADWTIDQGLESEIEEPWLAEEQEAEERRMAKRKRKEAVMGKVKVDRRLSRKRKPSA